MSSKQKSSAKKTKAKAPHGSRQARRTAGVVLQVLAGQLSPADAAGVLEISTPGYYLLESRAMNGLIDGCEPRTKGRARTAESELAALKKECDRLRRDCGRYQALARAAQRSAGITVPKKKASKAAGRRKHKPTVRALSVARRLGAQSEDEKEGKGDNVELNIIAFMLSILLCGVLAVTAPTERADRHDQLHIIVLA